MRVAGKSAGPARRSLLRQHRWRDFISNNRTVREWGTGLRLLLQVLQRRPLARLNAYQTAESALLLSGLTPRRQDAAWSHLSDQELAPGLVRYQDTFAKSPLLTRCLALKAPTASGEKGVLYVAFEYNLYRLLRGVKDPAAFHNEFDIVVGTSWSPTSYALLLWALRRLPGTLFLEASHPGERPKLERFHPRIRCVESMPCDWINPASYPSKPHASRTYDLLMVANWAPFKRHYELFAALAKMPPELRIALIGQKEAGWTSDSILNMASQLGARQQLDLFESIPIQKVREIQCDSKAALLMSRREGSCVAAVEALFANTPLGMREDAHVGSLQYVNEQTGKRLSTSRSMHLELMDLLQVAPHLQPRAWAQENISCHQSIHRLNDTLRTQSLSEGRSWTRDLSPMCWNPYPMYLNESDRQALWPVYQELHLKHPEVFPSDLVDTSHR